MNREKFIAQQRQRRRYRVRKKVRGTADQPRLSVFRSHRHIACQLIDDVQRKTLVSASTLEPEVRQQVGYGGNRAAAETLGKLVAQRAIAAGITSVRFDRGSYTYHGRVAALADAAREGGLQF